ncbi:hypothetical protein [Marinisporobacter balticus]|uniref:Uncharacterized protein n=1 Tax=Marinisporobacter balticus TaxID=2018667 RepID=A0A4R2K9U0_9FIRM|nr:hypothetical protein [Marinisporobacter balticus]TCO70183.1 hypothetical protein EV214_12718 [Marinisporobacter balticus]
MKCIKVGIILSFGLLLCAISIVLSVNANIGLGPWAAFHVGIIKHIPITLGAVQILTRLIIVVFTTIMGQIPKLGTITNMILIGVFIDMINKLQIIPQSSHLGTGIYVLGIGYTVQGIFELFHFDTHKIVHRSILDEYEFLMHRFIRNMDMENNN